MVLPSLLFLKVRIFKTLLHEARFIDGLERVLSRDPGLTETIVRDSGNRKIRDLTATREAGFVKIWERDAISGREKVFGMEMTELSSGCGIIVKKERECRIRGPFLESPDN